MVSKNYVPWLFKPGTNEFDKTLKSMPSYNANDIKWGYAKDDGTVRCRLGVMMGLYDLRKETGRPLPPSDGLKPLMVSMWNVGKGPIDDMSQVLSTCLPSFGPINGMCWIWIRAWMLMIFNAWRLNSMHAMSEFVLSDQCVSRKQLLAARSSHGKTYAAFLQTLFDTLEMPVLLRGVADINDSLSPPRPTTKKRRITYTMWCKEEDWIKFRTTPHSGHVPSHLPTLIRDEFLPSSAGKRNRGETTQDDNVDGEEGIVDGGNNMDTATPVNDVDVAATPVKKAPDRRKWCFRCSYWKKVKTDESHRFQTISRVEGSKPKKTNSFCMRCQVALCQDCFRPWHDMVELLPTPTDMEDTTTLEV
jgi:hypothetical protein